MGPSISLAKGWRKESGQVETTSQHETGFSSECCPIKVVVVSQTLKFFEAASRIVEITVFFLKDV